MISFHIGRSVSIFVRLLNECRFYLSAVKTADNSGINCENRGRVFGERCSLHVYLFVASEIMTCSRRLSETCQAPNCTY